MVPSVFAAYYMPCYPIFFFSLSLLYSHHNIGVLVAKQWKMAVSLSGYLNLLPKYDAILSTPPSVKGPCRI